MFYHVVSVWEMGSFLFLKLRKCFKCLTCFVEKVFKIKLGFVNALQLIRFLDSTDIFFFFFFVYTWNLAVILVIG